MYFGGQDAIYVDENANIDEVNCLISIQAINEIMKAAFANNGQTYDSVKRLYIKESLYEKML
jgi:acyl-CoA reductase-like NAD-dependent aldehyde dehydrogenase